ncbi:MAG: tetratricopeptide repeat protein, partial [Thermodesulfobacteriota bacterium]
MLRNNQTRHGPLIIIAILLGFFILTPPVYGTGAVKDEAAADSRAIHKTTLRELKSFAGKGDANAAARLAQMYYEGIGVKKDYKKALTWALKASEQGNTKAQSLLGLMYYKGHGVLRDYKAAFKWYHMAALHGDKGAQSVLGLMYAAGHGVTRNYQEAFHWYEKAALQGDAGAQSILGLMYYEG